MTRDTDTEDEIADISPASPHPSSLAAIASAGDMYLQLTGAREVEEEWKAHVSSVMRGDSNAMTAAQTFHIFSRLFQVQHVMDLFLV